MKYQHLSVMATALVLGACSQPGTLVPQPRLASFDIPFGAVANGQPVRCGESLQHLGQGHASARLRELRFYVSAVELIDAQGQTVPLQLETDGAQAEGIALIDLADGTGECNVQSPEIHDRLRGVAPAGNYRDLRFTVGVPAERNHTDYALAVAPLDVQAMAWAWQAGRKFMNIEILPEGGVARAGAAPGRAFQFHLGSTGCKGNPVNGETVACARPNRLTVALDGFDAARDRVVLDLSALYAGVDVNVDDGGASGCMSALSDPECAPIFAALGLDLASGTTRAEPGRVFRSLPR